MTDIKTLLQRYDAWETAKEALHIAEGTDDSPSSSQWADSDDEGVELARLLASALRQPVKVWTLTVVDDQTVKAPLTVTIHASEEACWESLRENYDPEGLADDEPPVAIVSYLENEQGLTIGIDVQEVSLS